MWAAMVVQKPKFTCASPPLPVEVQLPPGCIGVMWVFETRQAALDWHGPNARLAEIEVADAKEADRGKE